MRNLKRVLSLALALVMMLGMMIVGASAASADFPDAAEIDYTEAVDVVSGLGIMIGDDKGNFNPDQILTREMAAKVICYTLIGAENAEKLGKNTQIFEDVAAGRWSAGYIAYCANLGILVGDGNGLFRPEDNLTGVQFGKMLLVAAGYDAETEGYVGNDWATNIGTDMIAAGLDIKGVLMSADLTREQAAQMLLQAMDIDTVEYVKGNVVGLIGPYATGDTFAEKYFPKLEKIEGVITANEYADLYGTKPLAAGKTEIDGKAYKGSTALTDIGESRVGWANDGKILYLADSGENTVFSTGAETDISTDAKFKKVTGMTLAGDAEHFVNFDNAYTGKYVSDFRIAYGDPAALVVIPKNTAFSSTVLAEIEAIFNDDDDDYDGYVVYVGTQRDEDVSDVLSFKQFKAEYIEYYSVLDTDVTTTKNGEWLKVVDNDGDGKADYVFKTEFTLAEVLSLSNKGVLSMTGNKTVGTTDGKTPYVTSADLAKGDVVLWTTIDGVTYVELAPSFTGEVDKYIYKTDILTVEGEEYGQSAIGNTTDYFDTIADADKDTEYTYFQDWFGFIRAYALPAAADKGLVLLTDAYYETNRTGKVYAVDAYLDGEVTDCDVNGSVKTDVSMFIDPANPSDNDWGKLIEFETGATTNLARYTEKDGVLSLYDAKTYSYTNKGAIKAIKTDYVDLDEAAFKSGATSFTGTYNLDATDNGKTYADEATEVNTGAVKVQANKDTVYYYVSWVKGQPVIQTVVGYKNSIGVDNDVVGINAMYAVATNVPSDSKDNAYWVADIIVIETDIPAFSLSSDVALGYYVLNKTVKDYAALDVIGKDAQPDTLNVTSIAGYNTFVPANIDTPAFYFNTENEDGDSHIREITANFAKYDIYVGTVDRANALYEYVVAVGGKQLDYDADTVVYELKKVKNAYEAVTEDANGNTLKLATGKSYIFYAPKADVVYAVALNDYTADLYQAIYDDANPDEAALAAAKAAAIKTLEDAIVDAVKTEATSQGVTVDETKILTDDVTDITSTGWGVDYATVAKALDKWTKEINDATTDANLNAVVNAGHPATLATAYVATLKADANAAQVKAQVEAQSRTYMSRIKTALADPLTWTSGSTVKSLVEAEINTVAKPNGATKYTCVVTAPADVSFIGEHGTKTVDVTVSITGRNSGIVGDPVVETIAVTITW